MITSNRSADARLAKKMVVMVLSLRYRAMVNIINPVDRNDNLSVRYIK